MIFRCRCRKCERRARLDRHPDSFKKQPACRTCGTRSWRVDHWVMRFVTCCCDSYHFPHRHGSGQCKQPALALPPATPHPLDAFF